MGGRTFAALLVTVLLAGCFGAAPEADDPGTTPGATGSAGATDTGPTDPSAPAPAPDWAVGDWWRWSVTPRDHPAYEATTVVARVEGTHYLIGWDNVDQGLRSQFFHFIPHDEVTRADLAWQAHDEPVDWLDFPLMDGKEWTGGLWLTDMTFQATAANVTGPNGTSAGFLVNGTGADGGIRVELAWSTTLGIFTELRFYLFDATPWLALSLLESGRGRTEAVQVLHADFLFARFSQVEQHAESQTAPPVAEPVEVPAGATHVSIGCYLGGAPGTYAFRLTDAGGTLHACELQATDDAAPLVLYHGTATAGAGLVDVVTVGQGSVFAELVFAYAEAVTPG